jgi:hypothetical protein
MRRSKLVVALALGLLAVAGSALAYSPNLTRYPGSMCVRYSGSTSYKYYYSGLGNNSTSSHMYVDCPALNNYHGNRLDEYQGGAHWFVARDRSSESSVRCTLNHWYASGDLYGWTSSWFNTSGSKVDYQRVFLAVDDNDDQTNSYYYYSCRIPRKDDGVSYLQMYAVSED